MTWATNTVTVTVSGGHGYPTGKTLNLTIAGVTPAGYNGTFACTITSTTQFTYPLASNPGSVTTQGTVVVANQAVLSAMNTTFFAQPGNLSVYVLELGPTMSTDGITALNNFITANPGVFYSYLVPYGWDADATYPAFLQNYNSTTAKTYFFTTVTLTTYSNISNLQKCCPMLIQATNAPSTEFTMAAMFWATLNANPSSSNKVPPLAFTFLVGSTAGSWTGTQKATFKTNNVNFVDTGAEGGISNTLLKWGTTPDGNPWNYWYSVDWVQINLDLNIANAIINGSNTNINPLYYNQDGINRLQSVASNTLANAVSYGLALGQLVTTQLDPTGFASNVSQNQYAGQVVVNAVPFATYNQQNPSDYSIGKYSGLAAVYTPQFGFTQIIFNLNVTTFA
ncbi:hypothetical protein WM24_23840 [Burkholderia ubonensis]|nr:hypothetical protein WM24_23840 [Burkholderia ubonensis]